MLMTIKDRLIKYLEYKGISKRQFELSIGVSNGYINNMRVSIQPDKVRNIALHYPDLNTGWLMTGDRDHRGGSLAGHQATGGKPCLQRQADGSPIGHFEKGQCPRDRQCRMCRCEIIKFGNKQYKISKY